VQAQGHSEQSEVIRNQEILIVTVLCGIWCLACLQRRGTCLYTHTQLELFTFTCSKRLGNLTTEVPTQVILCNKMKGYFHFFLLTWMWHNNMFTLKSEKKLRLSFLKQNNYPCVHQLIVLQKKNRTQQNVRQKCLQWLCVHRSIPQREGRMGQHERGRLCRQCHMDVTGGNRSFQMDQEKNKGCSSQRDIIPTELRSVDCALF
jgi:hypothetical protein